MVKKTQMKVNKANYRCPRCRAKLKTGTNGFAKTYTCNRCGHFKSETENNWAKKLMWG